jgi:sarcosine oxidase
MFDAIVVGVGGMGSAATYHLTRRGARVLGLEQFNIGHDFGSSHGVTRIIRLAYAEGSSYVPMLRRAYTLWRQIQRVAREPLLFITGGVDAGPEDGAIVQGSVRSCHEHRLKHEQLDAGLLRRRFPGYRLPTDLVGIYQPDAGFVLSERAIVAYVTAAQALGAEIHGLETVRWWKVERGRVLVTTDRGKYTARKLVITAGAWASRIVPYLRRRRLAIPERQVSIWTQPRRPENFALGTFPIFNMEVAEDDRMSRYYGFPVFGVPGFKFGKYHHLHEIVDPATMSRECYPSDEKLLRGAIQRYFPDAAGPTLAMKTCLFTNSSDEHFVIGKHPDNDRVVIAAGFSGHGFKFASVIGEILADVALEGTARLFDLTMFDPLRRVSAAITSVKGADVAPDSSPR